MLGQPPSNISLGPEKIESRFGAHKATIEGPEATAPKHAELRVKFREFATYLDAALPPGQFKKWMFKSLEMASMWAHKSVAEMAPILSEGPPISPKQLAEFTEVSASFGNNRQSLEDAPGYETIDSEKLAEFIASAVKHGNAVGRAEDEGIGRKTWYQGMARYEWFKFYTEQATNPELQKLAQTKFDLGYRHCWDMTDHA